MALKLNEKYPGYMNAPSIDYPQGSFKNRTSPTAEDGSYFDQDWANDDQGFKQSLLSAAGVTANGQVDKVGASQYFDALKTVISKESPKTEFATQSEFDAHTSKTKVVSPFVMQPSATGSSVLTGLNNNIYFAGIVSSLGLEKGDVIRVIAGEYNKLHTVESITNSDNVIVNYEHCGLRGNGSLKLQDYTGSVTITRISKWSNAPIGLGQAPVVLTSLRPSGTEFINSTNRCLQVISSARSSGSETAITLTAVFDGVSFEFIGGGFNSSGSYKQANSFFNVSIGGRYKLTPNTGSLNQVVEVR